MHTWCRAVCDFRSRPLFFAHRILPAGLRSRFQLFTSSGGLPNHLDSLRLKAPLQPCVDEHADLLPTLEFSKSHFFSTTNAIKKVEPPALVTLSTGILRCRLSLSGIRKPRTLPINIGFYSNTVWFFLEVWWNDRHLHRHPNRCRLTPKALQNIVGEKLLAVRVGYILQQCKGQNIELDAAWLSRVVILTLMFFFVAVDEICEHLSDKSSLSLMQTENSKEGIMAAEACISQAGLRFGTLLRDIYARLRICLLRITKYIRRKTREKNPLKVKSWDVHVNHMCAKI